MFMRRIFLGAMFMLCLGGFNKLKAQEIGVRFGNGNVSDIAFDAVFAFGQFDRIHSNVSFGDDKLGVEALLDFIYKPFIQENFNWYAGAGPFLTIGDDFQFGAVGEIGLEYHFSEIPLALGLDWRPAFQIVDDTNFAVDGFGFNLRYVFGH